MERIVAAPAMPVSMQQCRPTRYLSTRQGRQELNRMYLLVREVSALFSHHFLVEKLADEEPSASRISIHRGPSMTYLEVAQDISLSTAANDGSLSVAYHRGPSTIDPIVSGQYEQDGITCVEDLFKDDFSSLVQLFKDADECPYARIDEWYENQKRVIWKGNDVPSSGLTDQIQAETATPDDPLSHFFIMEDLPPIKDPSNEWMVDYDPSPREGCDEIERGKIDQGRRGSFDSEVQQKDRQLGKEQMSRIKEVVSCKLNEIEASCQLKLENLKSEVGNISNRLKGEINRVKEKLDRQFEEMMITVPRFLNGDHNVRKLLPKAICRIVEVCQGHLRILLQNMDKITMDLCKVKEQLETQEHSVAESFQKSVSSIYPSMESILGFTPE